MKFSKVNRSLFIIIFFTLLSLFDLIYPSKGDDVNRTIPQIGRTLFFGLMLFTIFKIKFKKTKIPKPITGKGVNYMLFLFLFVSLLSLDLFFKNILSIIKILYWICGYYFFYYALLMGIIKGKHIEYFTIAAVTIYFLTVLRDYTNQNLWEGSKTFFVSNNAYHLLKCFPLVLLFKNRLTNVLILMIAIGLILAFKRGALLAFSVAFSLYYLYILLKVKKNKSLKLLLGVGIVIAGGYYYTANADVFSKRMEDFENVETAGSGRGKMFGLIIDEMVSINSDPYVLILGNGPYATKEFFQRTINHRIVAHSDFLEFFYDYGLIGIIGFVFFFYRVFKLYLYFRKEYYGFVIIIWALTIGLSSLYSVNFFAAEMIYAILPIVFLEYQRIIRINLFKSSQRFKQISK